MSHPSPTSRPRLDGAVIWRQLTPERQAEFGAAIMEAAIARYGVEVAPDERTGAQFIAAEEAATDVLDALVEQYVLIRGVVAPDEVPPLPSLLGPVCRECGCSEHDACWTPPWGEGCDWADEDLCTACAAEGQVRPRQTLPPEARLLLTAYGEVGA